MITWLLLIQLRSIIRIFIEGINVTNKWFTKESSTWWLRLAPFSLPFSPWVLCMDSHWATDCEVTSALWLWLLCHRRNTPVYKLQELTALTSSRYVSAGWLLNGNDNAHCYIQISSHHVISWPAGRDNEKDNALSYYDELGQTPVRPKCLPVTW